MTATLPRKFDLSRTMPDGRTLGYQDADHSYWLDGHRLASCSTVVGTLNKFNLTKRGGWIERETAIGAYHATKAGELGRVPEFRMWERVRDLGLGCGKADQAADRGKVIHEVMEQMATTDLAPNPAEVAAHARGWVRGAVRAWRALRVEDVVEREQVVCHPGLGFAGRFDLLCLTRPKGTVDTLLDQPVLSLVDYKTSARGRVWGEAAWQTRLYSLAIQETLGLEVQRIVIVGIGDNGSYELIECPCRTEAALALVTVWSERKRVDREIAAQRRAHEDPTA